jgi:adenine-specific DNA-methyltransferase
MKIETIKPILALNKAYFKDNLLRADLEHFKDKIKILYNRLEEAAAESEENLKNFLADFLKQAFYEPDFLINTKGRTDLAIHKGKSAKDAVSVLFETKKPNSPDLCHPAKPNTKAFQQLVLYYMRERVSAQNIDIQHLIVTDFYHWYLFDEHQFDKQFYQNAAFLKRFKAFEGSGKSTDVFYKEIAKPFLDELDVAFTATHFTLQTLEYLARKDDEQADIQLIPYYKILSPIHLLKLPFANDSNTLDKNFYTELLHLMGLEEVKTEGKKLIQRKKQRDEFSLLENTLTKIQNKGFLHLPNVKNWGQAPAEQAENMALELCLTWVNRILFLKLLEGQLVRYQRGNKTFCFLNPELLYDFNRVNKLFFEVLAERPDNRTGKTQSEFAHIPYLNSSLFERTDLERNLFEINYLDDHELLPLWSNTVLKDAKGNRLTGEMPTLNYFLAFLDAYDFASEGAAGIQEAKRTLINAAVLGLIFEKINGYKDGSFFTPGFITMYMSRETIRRAVLQKFQQKGSKALDFNDLQDEIVDRKAANALVNSLKICDPAVGSGHFLVSALNELLAIKSDLGILQYRDGKRVKDFKLEVVNDELVVFDEDAEAVFEYTLSEKGGAIAEKQRLQEMLFGEKQFLIENCLFGVDLNPNSVKICRLRLWIELLKNAFYTSESNYKALETLPNIDINIKQGNSLMSRFGLEADLSEVFKKQTFSVEKYRKAVADYKKTNDKTVKNDLNRFINQIKEQFQSVFHKKMRENVELVKLKGQLFNLQNQNLFGDAADETEIERFETLVAQAQQKVDAIKNNVLYQNAFEWRFEFPEVLDDEGRFVGFDIVIANPPYGVNANAQNSDFLKKEFKTFSFRGESYVLFIERALQILKVENHLSFIIPDTLLNLGFTQNIRNHLLTNSKLIEIDLLPNQVFNDATVDTMLLFTQKQNVVKDFIQNDALVRIFNKKEVPKNLHFPEKTFSISTEKWFKQQAFNLQSDNDETLLIDKIESQFPKLESFVEMFYGIKAYQVGKGKPAQTREIVDLKPFTSLNQTNTKWLPFFDGKHIGRYELLWKSNNWINYGAWLAEPRSPIKFEGEKILIRKIIGKTLIAHYIPYTSYCNTLLFVLKLSKDAQISYKSLLGILNSKFIGWYFRKKFQITDEDTFPQIMIRDILQFAIPNTQSAVNQQIENLVEAILAQKQADSSVSTAVLEATLDRLVYELYDLNELEIAMIEKAIS